MQAKSSESTELRKQKSEFRETGLQEFLGRNLERRKLTKARTPKVSREDP